MSDDTQLVERVEAKLNLERAASITVTDDAGGLAETLDYAQIFEVAKFMATSGPMVPSFCQGRPGVCLGIVLQAREWRMMPYQVARMAYVVSNRKTGEQVVSYMSQLIHAVIESRAPIADRLSVHYDGEGDDLTCTVSAPLRNRDGTPGRIVSLTSPTLGERKRALRVKITVGDDGEEASVKGSPLWVTKPKQQLFYDTSRDWARMFFPDVLMGVYSREEMEDQGWTEKRIPPASAAEPDSGFTRRLTSQAISRAGFDLKGVEEEAERIKNGEPEPASKGTRRVKAKAEPAPAETEVVTAAPETEESSPAPSEGLGEAST